MGQSPFLSTRRVISRSFSLTISRSAESVAVNEALQGPFHYKSNMLAISGKSPVMFYIHSTVSWACICVRCPAEVSLFTRRFRSGGTYLASRISLRDVNLLVMQCADDSLSYMVALTVIQ